MDKFRENYCYDSEDIAKTLLFLSVESGEEKVEKGLVDALNWLQSAAQNPFNNDYFRVFWNVLQELTDYTEIP